MNNISIFHIFNQFSNKIQAKIMHTSFFRKLQKYNRECEKKK